MNSRHCMTCLYLVISCAVLYLLINLDEMEYPLQMKSNVQPKPEEDKQREKRLKTVCKTFYYGTKERNVSFISNRNSDGHTTNKCEWDNCPVIIDDKKKVSFCFIPKVGCTFFKLQFLRSINDTIEPWFYFSNSEGYSFHTIANDILHRTSLAFHTHPKFRQLFNIIFVRHPFDRLVSAYRNKLERKGLNIFTKPLMSVMRKNRRVNTLSSKNWPTFKEFVLYLLENDPLKYNKHWKPYHIRCDPCNVWYNFIGKMETIDHDLKYLANKLNLNVSNTRINSSSKGTSLNYKYFLELTVKELKGLYEIYREDFELFGYNIDQVFGSRVPTN
ncbi:carbohydrate sulfotransferase 12-like isoform X1 [Tachypleus tridentatus]|uniref:carbohydrate sulfotransferase 12-like isoform X1 n=1 Tax=Tachypleus tridentatus TaxID=6853 RepID=UPI003FD50CA7